MDSSQVGAPPQPRYRVKLLLFVLCALVALVAVDLGYSTLDTLRRLEEVEAERDQWQRPSDVILALGLHHGDRVVDLGCGSGYFALKLSSPVGPGGRVIAEDIRRLPLIFLWIRKVTKGKNNLHLLLGDPVDPRLPARGVNAVLISNTYHEFDDAPGILRHLSEALVPGGRLVIVDRAPHAGEEGSPSGTAHEISSDRVERELRHAHFQILSRDDSFIISDPDHENWWLIVAKQPAA